MNVFLCDMTANPHLFKSSARFDAAGGGAGALFGWGKMYARWRDASGIDTQSDYLHALACAVTPLDILSLDGKR